ncbi:hypothetical protein [Paenibacillus sp. Soil522]|uniref:hypothetical protein n=1 Tax=Paenibacillus sp. Soil522 TaxID=1736388 RepID=UPI000AA53AD9|nr:hypothetical protein [Paenibacillus sp. Soil522]
MMRTDLMNCMRKPAGRNVSSFLLIVCLAVFTTGCIAAPSGSIPYADIAVTNNYLIVNNRSGDARYDVQITIDDKYTYEADVLSLGKSSLPLDEFVDDRDHRYKRGLLNIRNVTIYMPDTVDGEVYYRW